MATRCCWPPESWLGVWSMRSPRPTASSAALAPALALAPRPRRGTAAAARTFSSAVVRGSRLKPWKMKPMSTVAHDRARVARARRRRRDRRASRCRAWAGRGSRGCSSSSTCPSRSCPTMATNSPRSIDEVDVAHRMHEPTAGLVVLRDVRQLDERLARRRRGRRRPGKRNRGSHGQGLLLVGLVLVGHDLGAHRQQGGRRRSVNMPSVMPIGDDVRLGLLGAGLVARRAATRDPCPCRAAARAARARACRRGPWAASA